MQLMDKVNKKRKKNDNGSGLKSKIMQADHEGLTSPDSQNYISVSRIITLTDSIFAIAMTLLVLNFNLPNFNTPQQQQDILLVYGSLRETINAYALSFILLGSFWVLHHRQFSGLKQASKSLLWVNILLLMFVALVPFVTNFTGEYPDSIAAATCFNINLFFIGFFLFLSELVIILQSLKVTGYSARKNIQIMLAYAVFPLVAVLAIILSYFVSWSSWIYLSIPFAVRLVHLRSDPGKVKG